MKMRCPGFKSLVTICACAFGLKCTELPGLDAPLSAIGFTIFACPGPTDPAIWNPGLGINAGLLASMPIPLAIFIIRWRDIPPLPRALA